MSPAIPPTGSRWICISPKTTTSFMPRSRRSTVVIPTLIANLLFAIRYLPHQSARAECSTVPTLEHFFPLESFGRKENARPSQNQDGANADQENVLAEKIQKSDLRSVKNDSRQRQQAG